MAYYCGTCGSKLKSQRVKSNQDYKNGTESWISYKVLIVKTIRRYICPNGCVLRNIT
jgi:hypothetical protein